MSAWSFIVPIGEAPDEFAHWEYAHYVHANHRLPILNPSMDQWFQMPLYYLLLSPLATEMDWPTSGTKVEPGQPIRFVDPLKRYYHSDEDLGNYWPIRRGRLFTGLLCLIGVLFCYHTALEVTNCRSTAFLAAGLMALLPQFTFRSAAISNDSLATTLSAASIYYIVRMLNRGFSWTTAVLGTSAMGLAFVTKVHTLFLPAVWLLAILLLPGSTRTRAKQSMALGVWVVIAAGLLIRNYALYQDPLLLRTEAIVAAQYRTDRSLFSAYFLHMFPVWMSKSFVGWFGWMNLEAPAWLYQVFAGLLILSVIGYTRLMVLRKVDVRLTIVLVTTILLNTAVVVKANMTFTQPQGRYLFPALSAICVLCALGLRALPGWRPSAAYVAVAGLFVINVYILRNVVFPAYWDVPAIRQEVAEFAIGRLAGPLSVEQTFTSPCINLDRVDIRIGTYGERSDGQVLFKLEDAEQGTERARLGIRAREVVDSSFVRFDFWPVGNALGKQFRIRLRSTSSLGRGVGIWCSYDDTLRGGSVKINGMDGAGDIAFRVYCADQWGGGHLMAWIGTGLAKLL